MSESHEAVVSDSQVHMADEVSEVRLVGELDDALDELDEVSRLVGEIDDALDELDEVSEVRLVGEIDDALNELYEVCEIRHSDELMSWIRLVRWERVNTSERVN